MIGVNIKFSDKQMVRLRRLMKEASEGRVSAGALLVRTFAAKSIKRRGSPDKASPEGTPPFTHKGTFFRRAIQYKINKQRQTAIIGFSREFIGEVGAIHEHGETEEGRDYPERPTMGPALERAAPHFHRDWRASL